SNSLIPAIPSLFLHSSSRAHPDLLSFPTRRSSDLQRNQDFPRRSGHDQPATADAPFDAFDSPDRVSDAGHDLAAHQIVMIKGALDRKSTRLNSSHSQISYAVFCLKKKKITK